MDLGTGTIRASFQSVGNVVHGCFPEGGDSILSVFSWELLLARLLTSTKSRDQPDMHVLYDDRVGMR